MNILNEVVRQLIEKGFTTAFVAYPGYVSVSDVSFGTANGVWGWDAVGGEFGNSSTIPGSSEDVAAIVAWIVEVLTTNRDARTAMATANADTALWEAVMKVFPEAKSGDLSPLVTHRLTEALRTAVAEWVYYNVPKTCGGCHQNLDAACGKTIGCYECDEEFCSSDCLDAHTNKNHVPLQPNSIRRLADYIEKVNKPHE